MKSNEFGEKLAVARRKLGMTQMDVALNLKVSQPRISEIESGQPGIELDLVLRYADLVHVDVTAEARQIAESEVYWLKLFDEPLLKFALTRQEIGTATADLLFVDKEKAALLPKDLELSDRGVLSWLKHRTIPKNRAFVKEILSSLSLHYGDTKAIIDVCMGLSLHDSYWVTKEYDLTSFDTVNLYENRFDEALGHVAFTGYGSKFRRFTTSPELTTNGMLAKAWKFEDDGSINLYKQGTHGAGNAGREPFCEMYASQIAEQMGLHHVPYTVCKWKKELASVCPIFTSKDVSYVPAGSLKKDCDISEIIAWYKSLGAEYFDELASMLVFDALICNEDRHFGNFGLLFDSRTNDMIGPAPLFDHGMSLLPYITSDSMKNYKTFMDYASNRFNPYGIDSIQLAASVMGKKQVEQLKKLTNFKFRRDGLYQLSEKKLRYLERMIQERRKMIMQVYRGKS